MLFSMWINSGGRKMKTAVNESCTNVDELFKELDKTLKIVKSIRRDIKLERIERITEEE